VRQFSFGAKIVSISMPSTLASPALVVIGFGSDSPGLLGSGGASET
jgi:hypothetical protein